MRNKMKISVLVAVCCFVACSDSVEYESRSPDGKVSVIIGQPWNEFEERLAIGIRRDGSAKRVYVNTIDFRVKFAHAWWTPDSKIVTVVACNSYGPPQRITYDVARNRRIYDPPGDILNPIRSSVALNYSRAPRELCRYDDPLVWICCPETSKK